MEENYKNESMVDVAYSILKNEGTILSFTELFDKVAEIEALGDIDAESDENKHCTNKIKIIREITGLDLKRGKDVVDNLLLIKTNISLDEANSIKKQIEEVGGAVKITEFNADDVVISQTELNIPKCPTCGSTDISKISTASKAVSVGLFGIFSSKIRKQFHCNSCKYEW